MIKNTFVVIISCLVAIFSIEISLRFFYPMYLTGGYIGAYQYNEKLGYSLKMNVHLFKTTDYQQEIYTNNIGSINFQKSFDRYPILIFAIGDSYTQGVGLPSDASYPFQLDLILNMPNKEYLNRYAVVNLGLAGFGGEQGFLMLSMYKEILGKPNYILYLGCSNDHMDDILFRNGYRHRHLVDGNKHYGSIFLSSLQWLRNETEIGKRVATSISTLRHQSYMRNDAHEQGDKDNASVAALEEPVLNKLLAASNEMNAILIVSWADLETSSRSYQWLKEWAREKHVAFADWQTLVESVRKAIPEIPFTNPHSGGHYRTWINTMIAKAFAEQIRQ
jgi:hypothetical protein